MNEVLGKKRMASEEVAGIKKLWDTCNLTDGLAVKVNWDMLKERDGESTSDFLWYEQGELAGFVTLYQFHKDEIECTGMVHPRYRRQGIGMKLFRAALSECRRRGAPRLLAIYPDGSASGEAFVSSVGGIYRFAEYTMLYDPARKSTEDASAVLTLRQASMSDLDYLVELNSEGFGMNAQDAREYADRTLQQATAVTYIAELEGEPVASIRLTGEEGEQVIYGFVVAPDYRGRGFGTEILRAIIRSCDPKLPLKLEVAADNPRALKLYERSGFRVVQGQRYADVKY